MQTIADTLNDPAVRSAYLLFCLALLVLPMLALSAWYQITIRKSAGGRRLMKEQAKAIRSTPRCCPRPN